MTIKLLLLVHVINSQWGRKQLSKLKNPECSCFLPHLYTESKWHRWWLWIKKSCEHILTIPFSEQAVYWRETFYSFFASLYPVWILVIGNVNSLRATQTLILRYPDSMPHSRAFRILILLLGLCRRLFLREETFILNLQETSKWHVSKLLIVEIVIKRGSWDLYKASIALLTILLASHHWESSHHQESSHHWESGLSQ